MHPFLGDWHHQEIYFGAVGVSREHSYCCHASPIHWGNKDGVKINLIDELHSILALSQSD